MSGMTRIKAGLRDALPASWQVPAKYWHARLAGTLEPEMELLPRIVGSGTRAIDIGGNYGAYAKALAALGARVEVFEPHAACLNALEAWARGRGNVRVHPCALSDHAGEAEFAIPVEADGTEHDAAGSIASGHSLAQGRTVRTARVALKRLDDFRFAEAAFVKIDVEGHEMAVIDGARATIAACRPVLLVEIEQRHSSHPVADSFATIAALGYDGHFLLEGRMTPIARFAIDVHQRVDRLGHGGYHNNFLFWPRERGGAGLPGA